MPVKTSTEVDRLHGAVKRDSPEWHEAQSEALSRYGQLAGQCHPWVPAIQVYLYLLDENEQKADIIGMSWVCGYQEWDSKGTEHCRRPVTRGTTKNYTMRAFKAIPSDFTQNVWEDMKQVGPMMHGKGRFGYYCIRGIDQELKAYAPKGRSITWLPRQESLGIEGNVPSHGQARIHALAGDAYVKESDPDYGDAIEPF